MENDFILSGPKEDLFIPHNVTLGQFFFKRLRERSKDEVICVNAISNETITTGKLLENAVKMIHIFKQQGLNCGDVISFSSENTIEFGYPILAAFAMGVTMNLLNSNYSVDEIKYALNIAKPKLVICTEHTMQNIAEATDSSTQVFVMNAKSDAQFKSLKNLTLLLEETIIDTDSYNPESLDCKTHDALLLFSSGTTGLPKGVLITHEMLKNYLHGVCHPIFGGYCGNHVILGLLPLFFVFGLFGLLSVFIHPTKLIVLTKFQPTSFLQAIDLHKVTKLPITPPTLLFLAKSTLVNDYNLSSLRDIIVGGASISSDLLREAAKVLGNTEIRQAYGLTEVGSCVFAPLGSPSESIGKLSPNYKVKIWNSSLEKNVGPFDIGELCIKPPHGTVKYINANGLLKSIDDEFYQTGDLGYFDDNGYLFITGRTKDIIKYKGYQVSPAELENLLLQHSEIEDSAVIGIPDEKVGELPFAFVVSKHRSYITVKDVIEYIAGRISLQKQLHGGAAIVTEIPRNSNGKILRDNLIKMYNKVKLS